MAKTVDDFIDAHEQWRDELAALRQLLLKSGLTETVKWGAPTYCLDGGNVAALGAFKGYCGLWFFQGALLDDPDGVLVNAQPGRTQAMRQLRFPQGTAPDLALARRLLAEAIENQRAGRVVAKAKPQAPTVPDMLQQALDDDAQLATAFAALSPGKQREYIEHIADAKREATQRSRLEKILPMIRQGSGLNDRYRKR